MNIRCLPMPPRWRPVTWSWMRWPPTKAVRNQALLPHMKATGTAIQWWTAVIDSGSTEAVVELSDLYEWLIAIQPARQPGPIIKGVLTTWAKEFWTLHAYDPAPVGDHVRAAWCHHFDSDPPQERSRHDADRTITWTEQGLVAPAVERALRTAALWRQDDVVHTGAILAALAEEDTDGDWGGLWDCLDHPHLDDLAHAEDSDDHTGGAPLVLDDGTFTTLVSGHVAGALTSAARTAARHGTAAISPGLLALALITAEGSAARRVLLAHSGLDHRQLADEVLTCLVRHRLPDHDDLAASPDDTLDRS